MVQGQTGRKDASDELRKRITGSGGPGSGSESPPDAMAELEAAINKIDSMDARELLRAKAKSVRLKLEAESNELEKRIHGGNNTQTAPNNGAEIELKKDQIVANAILLLEKGLPANVVGQYLTGGMAGNIPVNLGNMGGQQGLNIGDIKTIMDMMKGQNSTDPQLTATLNRLNDRLENIERERKPADEKPRSWVIVNADGTVQRINSDEPIVIRPPVPANTGKSIEEIKEENRHAEVLEAQKTEREYKEKIAGVVAELPERIGAGLGGRMLEQEESSGPAAKTSTVQLEHWKCKAEIEGKPCGFDILIPPGATTEITCPKCGTIYGREPK